MSLLPGTAKGGSASCTTSVFYVNLSKNSSLSETGRSPFSGCKGTNFSRTGQIFLRLFSGKMQKARAVLTAVKAKTGIHIIIYYAREELLGREGGEEAPPGRRRTAGDPRRGAENAEQHTGTPHLLLSPDHRGRHRSRTRGRDFYKNGRDFSKSGRDLGDEEGNR